MPDLNRTLDDVMRNWLEGQERGDMSALLRRLDAALMREAEQLRPAGLPWRDTGGSMPG